MRVSVALLIFLWACSGKKVYHHFNNLPNFGWRYPEDVQTFEFEIKDTSLTYQLSALFRHTDKYPFCNFYFQYRLLDSAKSTISARLKNIDFYDCKTGQPLGKGSVGLFTHSLRLSDEHRFAYAGKYYFQIEQYMRLDTLIGMQAVGLLVEKKEE